MPCFRGLFEVHWRQLISSLSEVGAFRRLHQERLGVRLA